MRTTISALFLLALAGIGSTAFAQQAENTKSAPATVQPAQAGTPATASGDEQAQQAAFEKDGDTEQVYLINDRPVSYNDYMIYQRWLAAQAKPAAPQKPAATKQD